MLKPAEIIDPNCLENTEISFRLIVLLIFIAGGELIYINDFYFPDKMEDRKSIHYLESNSII